MKNYAEGLGLDDIPFPEAYVEFAGVYDSVHALANVGAYGLFNSNVVRQIIRPSSEFLPRGKFFNQFRSLFLEQDGTQEELFDLGVDIGASISDQNKSPRNLILGYVNAGLHMDLLRASILGQNRNQNIHTADSIYRYAEQVIAEALPLDDKTVGTFKALAEAIGIARHVDPQHEAVFTLAINKLSSLHRLYLTRKEFNDYVSRYYPGNESLPDEEKQAVDNGAALLTLEAMKHRKYGTKPAYIEASTGGSWVFYDGDAFLANIQARSGSATTYKEPPAAIVMHVPARDLSNVDMTIESLPVGKSGNITRTNQGLMAADPDFAVIIHLNGSISIDSDGLSPIETVLSNSPTAARMLKAEIAANFYDLSMPINIGTPPAPKNYAQMTAGERQGFDPIRQLLIPRLRHLHAPPEEEPSERTRIVRRHDVTWYVRPLPQGWRASPDAIANAAELGVVLEPNETFVRKHERGFGPKTLGYHAVRRAIDQKPGQDY